MSDDDRFDDFLRNAARDYNAPPPTPRDAMWARIDAERRARADAARAVEARQLPLRRLWWPLAIGIAAALVLGIGIGRWWGAGGRERGAGANFAAVPGSTQAPAVRGESAGPRAPGSRAGAPADTAPAGATVPRTPSEPERARTFAGRGAAPTGPVGADAGSREEAERRFYEAAAVDHLGRAEVLLTSFREESKRGTVDAQVTAWAGDLLGTTRLLLDSPATEDPRLRKLLGDLEVVLAQIAQLHPTKGVRPDELQIIDEAVRDHDMMTRLRTAIPAGTLPAGS
ncbi:MAG TPA: hypothetical protein VF041_16640 [Gemmatimonadaceae bacterium]